MRAPLRARPHDGQKRASLPCSVPQRGHAEMPGSRSSVSSRFSPSACSSARSSASTAASAAILPRTSSVFWRLKRVLVEDEAAEVAEPELAHAAQEAQAAAEATAVAEARLGRRGRVLGLGSRRDGGAAPRSAAPRCREACPRVPCGRVRAPARRSWQQALHMERAPSLGASDREYSGAPDTSIHASSTRRAMRSADHSAARARPVDAGIGGVEMRGQRRPPDVAVVRRAERARDAVEGRRVDADGRGEDGDVARERLEHGEAEALVRRRARRRRWRR